MSVQDSSASPAPVADGPPDGDSGTATAGSDAPLGDLHQKVLPWWGMYATSVGSVAPTAGLALAIAGVSLTAGNGTWLTWLVIMVGIGAIGYCISRLARHFATSGGMYGMGALVGGQWGGYLQGTAQLAALLIALPALVIGAGIYMINFLGKFGIGQSHGLSLACYLAIVAATLYFTLTDVRISARVLLLLELGSVTLILLLFVIVLANHHGSIIAHQQLSLKGVTAHDMLVALAFAMYSMAGFENSATLGKEAKNPHRDIPRAVLGTVLVVGVLYVFASYVEILGLPGGRLGSAAAPLSSLSTVAGISWFGTILDVCVALSFFACMLAATNTGARVLFTLGRDGVIPRPLGRASAQHGEPWVALCGILGATALAVTLFALLPTAPVNAYDYIGTLSGYMFIGVYSMAIVLAVRHAITSRTVSPLLVGAALLGSATMGIAIYYSFVPLPTGPYLTVFWIFIAITALAAIGLVVGLALRPAWWRRIGAGIEQA